MAKSKERGVKPSLDAWKRVSRATSAYENGTRPAPLRESSRVGAPPLGAAFGTVSVEITAGTWGSPGEGKATLESTGQEVAVKNRLVNEEITVGTNLVLLWIGGAWQAFATCP